MTAAYVDRAATRSRPGSFIFPAAIVLASLWMRTGFPVYAYPDSMLDDGLFARSARYLAEGHWLGPYDNATLAKGMGYPLFIAASAWAGLPLKCAEQIVYLLASGLAGWAVARFSARRSWGMATFAVLALNPVLWHEQLARAVRDGIYLSQTLAIVVLAGVIARPGRRRLLPAALLGLVYGTFWLTREEGVWLMPTVGLMLALGAILAVAAHPAGGLRARLAGCWTIMLSGIVAIGAFAVVDLAVCAINWNQYGVFTSSEFHQRAFNRGYGALARVEPAIWRRYVVFPREVWASVFAQSAAARELQPFLEGKLGDDWRRTAAQLSGNPDDPEILSGWFVWVLRDAVAAAGHYRRAPDAAAFYNRMADEIDVACTAGRLKCLPPRATLAPPWRWNDLNDTLRTVPSIAALTFTMGDGKVGAPPSQGDPGHLARFSELVGPITQPDRGQTAVHGWLVSKRPAAEGEPQITIQPAVGGGVVTTSAVESSGADLVAPLPGTHGFHFSFDTDCDASCTVQVAIGATEEANIPWNRFVAMPGLNEADFWLNIDGVQSSSLEEPLFVSHYLQMRLGHLIGLAYAAIVPAASVIASLGLAAALVAAPIRRAWAPSIVLAAGAASAVVVRILLLSYLDATSLPAATVLYSACVMPCLLLFITLGLHLLTQVLAAYAVLPTRTRAAG